MKGCNFFDDGRTFFNTHPTGDVHISETPICKIAPTSSPTDSPTELPTPIPTQKDPTASPTEHPTPVPTASHTQDPTASPTEHPTLVPTHDPTSSPTDSPTIPTDSPTTARPTNKPTTSAVLDTGSEGKKGDPLPISCRKGGPSFRVVCTRYPTTSNASLTKPPVTLMIVVVMIASWILL